MGFLASSCSFTRLRVKDQIQKDFWQTVPDKLKQFAFHDIDDVPDDRSYGWVSFDDLLDTTWEETSPYKGNMITFSLRMDTRRIPAGVINKHLMIAFKEELKKLEEINKNYISRERKKELKEQVVLKLKQRFLPIPSEFNIIWFTDKNEIWFCSTQGKMIDLFIEFFKQSFELNLEQITPVVLAEKFLDEETLTKLDTLEETQFVVFDDTTQL